MTGTGEEIGEGGFANIGETDEAHFEVVLHTAEASGSHELGVIVDFLLFVLGWHVAVVGMGYEERRRCITTHVSGVAGVWCRRIAEEAGGGLYPSALRKKIVNLIP